MKEPWEILVDEFVQEARRHIRAEHSGTVLPLELAKQSWAAAIQATGDHLVGVLHWRQGDAQLLLQQFEKAIKAYPKNHRAALRRVWEQWQAGER